MASCSSKSVRDRVSKDKAASERGRHLTCGLLANTCVVMGEYPYIRVCSHTERRKARLPEAQNTEGRLCFCSCSLSQCG